jgi:hypothetical protein
MRRGESSIPRALDHGGDGAVHALGRAGVEGEDARAAGNGQGGVAGRPGGRGQAGEDRGDLLLGPRRDERDEPARMLCMFAPAGFEQFFLDVMAETRKAGGDLRAVIGPLRAHYGDEDHPGQ